MPVPSNISELSTTPGSNSPSGSDAPSVLDDHIRTVYAFIKTLDDTKLTAIADGSVSTAKLADLAVTTAKLAADGVTFAKLQNIATARFLGRTTAGSGDIEELTASDTFTAIKQAASETATGVVEMATTSEASTGTDTTRAVTAAGVEAHMNANALGWSQTWQNLTGSRATSTTYTNSTGRPIEVKVIYTGGGVYEATFEVDSLQVQYETRPAGAWVTVGAIVPNGSTYRATSTGTYNAWRELR